MAQQTQALGGGGTNPVLNDEAFGRAAGASGAVEGAMSVSGTYAITVVLMALLLLGAAFGWAQVEIEDLAGRTVVVSPDWVWLVTLAVFVLAIVTAVNPGAAPITAPLYALTEGAVLGVVSKYYDLDYDGIVAQAIASTLAVFGAMLLLYLSRVVRVTPRFVLGVLAALGGLSILYLTAWLLWIFGADIRFWDDPSPVGIVLSVAIVALGALTLPIQFDFIERAAGAGYPSTLRWYGAYGLMLSLIWIYLSVLRLLAISRR